MNFIKRFFYRKTKKSAFSRLWYAVRSNQKYNKDMHEKIKHALNGNVEYIKHALNELHLTTEMNCSSIKKLEKKINKLKTNKE